MSDERRRVLFLCTHNSARSQMAEGLLRHLGAGRFDAASAGTEATSLRPLAIRAMAELGIDISGQESKTLERYLGQPFDAVITVCDQANESCPTRPGPPGRRPSSWPCTGRCATPSASASSASCWPNERHRGACVDASGLTTETRSLASLRVSAAPPGGGERVATAAPASGR
ncbi:MAG: arsenate reductase ArsC [Chloroflexota bacterium]